MKVSIPWSYSAKKSKDFKSAETRESHHPSNKPGADGAFILKPPPPLPTSPPSLNKFELTPKNQNGDLFRTNGLTLTNFVNVNSLLWFRYIWPT